MAMTKMEPSDEANDIRLLFSGDEALHNLKPTVNLPPPHNSIPPELVHRYDPVYVEYYNKYNVGRLYFDDVPMEEFRRAPGRYVISYGRAAGPDIFRITEQKCPVKGGEVTVRIFEPPPVSTADGKPKKRAAYVNYHGGCWIVGSLASDHEFCKRLVHELDGQLVVFDVDYRLAPEHPYPIPVDDSWAAFQWIYSQKADEFNLDVKRFAVGGVSAGGHLAAVVAHLCRDAQISLGLQVLCVPICDLHNVFTATGDFDRQNCPYNSYRELEHSAGMTMKRMSYSHKHFLRPSRPPRSPEEDWKISPILAPDFSHLAPALIFTAEMDPLRDEGEAYAAQILKAGSKCELLRMAGAPHPFAHLDGILEAGRTYNSKVIRRLKEFVVAT